MRADATDAVITFAPLRAHKPIRNEYTLHIALSPAVPLRCDHLGAGSNRLAACLHALQMGMTECWHADADYVTADDRSNRVLVVREGRAELHSLLSADDRPQVCNARQP